MKIDPTNAGILLTLLGILVTTVRGFTRLEELLNFTRAIQAQHEERLEGHEGRIGKLEVSQARLEPRPR